MSLFLNEKAIAIASDRMMLRVVHQIDASKTQNTLNDALHQSDDPRRESTKILHVLCTDAIIQVKAVVVPTWHTLCTVMTVLTFLHPARKKIRTKCNKVENNNDVH